MANFTDYFDWTTAKTLYAEPRPSTDPPASTVAYTENVAVDGEYSATLDDMTDYVIREQAGGSPAATDTAIGFVESSTTGGSGGGFYSLTVTVEDGDTNAVQGARVTIDGTNYDEVSGSDGTLQFNLDDGSYTLITQPPSGYDTPSNEAVTISGANDTLTITVTATVPAGSVGWLG